MLTTKKVDSRFSAPIHLEQQKQTFIIDREYSRLNLISNSQKRIFSKIQLKRRLLSSWRNALHSNKLSQIHPADLWMSENAIGSYLRTLLKKKTHRLRQYTNIFIEEIHECSIIEKNLEPQQTQWAPQSSSQGRVFMSLRDHCWHSVPSGILDWRTMKGMGKRFGEPKEIEGAKKINQLLLELDYISNFSFNKLIHP